MNSSDYYYNRYKTEELGIEDKKKGISVLEIVLKLEIAIILSGFIFIGYNNIDNNFSIEFNKDILFSKKIVDEPTKYSDKDTNLELLKQLKESPTDTVEPIEIKEDKPNIHNHINKLAKDLHIKSTDLSLIVEIIKSEMNPNNSSNHEDKIMIGQL